MLDRLKLFLLKLVLRLEGWTKGDKGWIRGGLLVYGDGSDHLRIIARRLFARERLKKDIKKKIKNHDKQT